MESTPCCTHQSHPGAVHLPTKPRANNPGAVLCNVTSAPPEVPIELIHPSRISGHLSTLSLFLGGVLPLMLVDGPWNRNGNIHPPRDRLAPGEPAGFVGNITTGGLLMSFFHLTLKS